jgi:prepilin-type N-terminal cleavage/methylation domain-containing protein
VRRPRRRGQSGFTLLEVLVAAMIMGIAVAGLMGGLVTSTRNAARLSQYDRATLLARQKMDELLVATELPRSPQPIQGTFDPASSGGQQIGWSATILPFETAPGAGPGQWVVDRIQLQISWMDGETRHEFALEGFRRGILQVGDHF